MGWDSGFGIRWFLGFGVTGMGWDSVFRGWDGVSVGGSGIRFWGIRGFRVGTDEGGGGLFVVVHHEAHLVLHVLHSELRCFEEGQLSGRTASVSRPPNGAP